MVVAAVAKVNGIDITGILEFMVSWEISVLRGKRGIAWFSFYPMFFSSAITASFNRVEGKGKLQGVIRYLIPNK